MPGMGVPSGWGRPNKFKGITKAAAKPASGDLESALSKVSASFKDIDQRAGGVKFVDREKHNKMGKNEFLKLMSHQLQNQDPMNPMDQNKFAADLAQFAQLEQMSNMNSNLEGIRPNAKDESKVYAASFLGKRVYTSGSSVEFKGDPTNIHFSLDKPAEKVLVKVVDNTGGVVAQIPADKVGKGNQMLVWDGNQSDGYPAKADSYNIVVQAWDEYNQNIPTSTQSAGVVQSVAFDKTGTAIFRLDNGNQVALRDISRFEIPKIKNKPAQAKNLVKNFGQGGEIR